MVRRFSTYLLFLTMSLGVTTVWGQAKVFSEVRLNKGEVFVGEPVQLTISVYTSTFFTKGVDPGNIKINGAFSVYFRAVSSVKKISGVTYAGVDLIYNVFPFEEKDLVIPSLQIEVETPNPGDYKGVRRTLKTRERILRIKPPPASVSREKWLVTPSLSVTESWGNIPSEIRVGEVLERSIRRRASGTVSELIPPVKWDSIPGVSQYPARSEVQNDKSRNSISGTRTEGMRYLFEKEGEVVIPDLEFVWWHPYQKKMYKRTLKGKTIKVVPNPDLEMLRTSREALSASVAADAKAESEEQPFRILGLTVKELLIWSLLLAIGGYFLVRGGRRLFRHLSERKRRYRASEHYAFKVFLSRCHGRDPRQLVDSLYQWIGHLPLEEPTLVAFAAKSGNRALQNEIRALEAFLGGGQGSGISLRKDLWRNARKEFLKGLRKNDAGKDWINPL